MAMILGLTGLQYSRPTRIRNAGRSDNCDSPSGYSLPLESDPVESDMEKQSVCCFVIAIEAVRKARR